MSGRAPKAGRYPREIMPGVHWSFVGPKFRSRARFVAAVREYYRTVGFTWDWDPDAVVLRASRVVVVPDIDFTDGDEEPEAEFAAAGADGFTAGDLLYQAHNAFVGRLRRGDHVFFEGFTLAADQDPHGPPRYDLELGS
jgi:hypothetical protein